MTHRDMEHLVIALGGLTRFNGICGIDWVHDLESDRLVILELNPRPTPGVYLEEGLRSGVSMSRGIRAWLSGKPYVQGPPLKGNRTKEILIFPQNLFRAVDDRNLLSFLRTFAFAPWDDPLLLAAQLRRFATHYLPASWKARARQLIQVLRLGGAPCDEIGNGRSRSPGQRTGSFSDDTK